jgi:hypothetical protein
MPIPVRGENRTGHCPLWTSRESCAFSETINKKGGITMAEKAKSKTNVAARAQTKGLVQVCRYCGNKVDVVMSVSGRGKKKMRRVCCEAA